MWGHAVTAGCAALLAVVLGTSAAAKSRDLPAFTASLPSSVPPLAGRPRTWRPLAVTVVAGEAVTSALLVLAVLTGGRWAAITGFIGALVSLAGFTVVITAMLRREVRRSCHCFGARSAPPSRLDLVRNILLVGVSALGLVVAVAAGGASVATPIWVATGAGVTLALLLLDLDGLAWLAEPVRPYGA